VVILHTSQLYTLWVPILYAHLRPLIYVSWPEDGCNAAETCKKRPRTFNVLALTIVYFIIVSDVKYMHKYEIF